MSHKHMCYSDKDNDEAFGHGQVASPRTCQAGPGTQVMSESKRGDMVSGRVGEGPMM